MLSSNTTKPSRRRFGALSTRAAAVIGVVAVSVASAGPAQATYAIDPTSGDDTTKQMVVAGYDADVAKANGYRIVTLADGTPNAMPVSDKAKAADQAIGPQVTVPGDCGTSSVVILDDHLGHAAVSTGFALKRGAISYGWQVNITGPTSGYTKNFGGTLASRLRWTANFNWTVPVTGTYIAKVADWSWVLLNNGIICVSAGPVDKEYVHRR